MFKPDLMIPNDSRALPASTSPGSSGLQILVTMSLLLVFALSLGCGEEAANWQLAAGLNEVERGNLEQAIQLIQGVVDQYPDRHELKLTLARLMAENEQGELGIALCDQFLERFPDRPEALQVRSNCLMMLGRFDESLADYESSISRKLEKSEVELNNLAYFRALARKDLPRAFRDIQRAIEKEESTSWGCIYLVPLSVRTTVSLGLISRHVGEQELALEQLDRMIASFDENWRARGALLTELVSELVTREFPLSTQRVNQTSRVRVDQEITRNSLGIMLATRILVAEDLGRTKQVDADRREIKRLGFDLDELLGQLPDEADSLRILKKTCLFIDTRGFVLTRLAWQPPEMRRWADELQMNVPGLLSSYEQTLADLDLAVAAASLLYKATRSQLYNRYDYPPKVVQRERRQSRKDLAVLTYHRLQAHERAGQEALAEADADRIRALGLKPDASLF